MEVGDEGVDGLELVARIDKNGGFAGFGGEFGVALEVGFERADRGGADGEDFMPGGADGVEGGGGGFGDVIFFGVHLVILDVVDLDGAEGPKADMEGDFDDMDTFLLDLVEEFWGEMKAGGGGGSGAEFVGVDGLIVGLVLELLMDVGRERHGAEAVENFEEDTVISKVNMSEAVGEGLGDGGGEERLDGASFRVVGVARGVAVVRGARGVVRGVRGVVKEDLSAGMEALLRASKAFPVVVAEVIEKQELDGAAGVGFGAVNASGENFGLVENEGIAGLKII